MLGEHSLFEVILFFAIIASCLWCDLHAHRSDKPVSARNAGLWTGIWVALAFCFAGYIAWKFGAEQMQLFIAGYFLEESLSVDNLFVMMAIFGSFSIRDEMQHRVLYYGILGALVLRFVFVAVGTSLVALFGPYALAGFGLFVLWTAWKMWQGMRKKDENKEDVDYTRHWAVRYTQRFVPIWPRLSGHAFFVRKRMADSGNSGSGENSGENRYRWMATPLFLCLVVVEFCDVMFAFDSVPAIIAITQDPFLVYTSNIFAILGLRSMYFLLAAARRCLCHLEKAVVIILAYIGFKMLLDVSGAAHIPALASLIVVLGMLLLGILASIVFPKKEIGENHDVNSAG